MMMCSILTCKQERNKSQFLGVVKIVAVGKSEINSVTVNLRKFNSSS
jgi:hypothetical protein